FVVGGIAFAAYKFGQNSNTTVNTEIAETNSPVNLAVNKSQPNSISNTSQPSNPINLPAVSQNVSSAPSSINISGEMYVITKGRQNIKLAAVEICAVSESAILNWIKLKKDGA